MMQNLVQEHLVASAASVAIAVLPLATLFFLFQIFLLKLPFQKVKDILLGTVLAAVGLFLFLFGINLGFLPFGRLIGEVLGSAASPWSLIVAGIILGFVTTWGEPAVRILADQVDKVSQGTIPGILVLYAICLGVAAFVGIGTLRISYGMPLMYILAPGYCLAIVMIWLSDRNFVAIALDAGGVATGPLANTFLLTFALGATAAMHGRSILIDGLGFVSLIALAPIISVLALGLFVRRAKPLKE